MHYDVFISYNSKDVHVAEAVCHYIEERRLRCFIAPRDITPPDWASSITSAIESAKAFVIIVSEHSITSNEVAKEIALATNVSDYIFPFRIDNSQLDGRMTYHLAPFHWIDAVTPPMEKRLNELADRVAASLLGQVANLELGNLSGSCNKSRQRLLGQSVHPRSEFIGRNSELNEIHSLLSASGAVFLAGMGGIGKSEIAKAYAQAHRDIYTTTIFASYETDLLHLIASDSAIPVENLQQAALFCSIRIHKLSFGNGINTLAIAGRHASDIFRALQPSLKLDRRNSGFMKRRELVTQANIAGRQPCCCFAAPSILHTARLGTAPTIAGASADHR